MVFFHLNATKTTSSKSQKRLTSINEVAFVLGQGWKALDVLRGVGVSTRKSLAFLAESVQPSFIRAIDVELPGAGAAAPSKQLAVLP